MACPSTDSGSVLPPLGRRTQQHPLQLRSVVVFLPLVTRNDPIQAGNVSWCESGSYSVSKQEVRPLLLLLLNGILMIVLSSRSSVVIHKHHSALRQFVLQEKRREGWRLKASVKVNRKKLLLILCRLRCTNTNLPPWKSVWIVSAQKDKMSTCFVLIVLFLSFWLSSFQLFTVPSEGDYLLCRQGI